MAGRKRTARERREQRSRQADRKRNGQTVLCDYCGRPASLIQDSTPIYGKNYGPLWVCGADDARVGCHPGTTVPLGRLANGELRRAKQQVHALFDWMWKIKVERGMVKAIARNSAYLWLADKMGIPRQECHIGMFDLDRCRLAVTVLEPYQGLKDSLVAARDERVQRQKMVEEARA